MTDTPTPPDPSPENPIGPTSPTFTMVMRAMVLVAALVWLTWKTGWWGLLIVLGLVVMITLHEFGHFYMARRAGMKVTEFFVGFGPRLWSIQRGETEYGIKLIPAGAYVRIIGMTSAEEVDPSDESRTYRAKPFWQRFGVAVAGSTMHFIQAFVLVFILLVGFGQPGGHWMMPTDKPATYEVGNVYSNCPGAEAGFRAGDILVSVNGRPITNDNSLRDGFAGHDGKPVTMVVRRDGKLRTLTPTLLQVEDDPAQPAVLGIDYRQMVPKTERVGFLAAIPQTFQELGFFGVEAVKGIGRIFKPSSLKDYGTQVVNARDDKPVPATTLPTSAVVPSDGTEVPAEDRVVSKEKCVEARATGTYSSRSDGDGSENRFVSILGIFQLGQSAGQASGIAAVLSIFALINIFIGVFNLTPMLPFDGGHVVVAVYEKIQERRKGLKHRYLADVNKLLPVVYLVVAVLGIIFVSSIYLDATNPLTVK